MTESKDGKQAQVIEKTRFRVFLDELIDLGFTIFATLNAILLLLQLPGWLTLGRSIWILLLVAWCPFFWGQYLIARSEARWTKWAIFGCAIAFTATTLLAIIVILIRTGA